MPPGREGEVFGVILSAVGTLIVPLVKGLIQCLELSLGLLKADRQALHLSFKGSVVWGHQPADYVLTHLAPTPRTPCPRLSPTVPTYNRPGRLGAVVPAPSEPNPLEAGWDDLRSVAVITADLWQFSEGGRVVAVATRVLRA